MGHTVLPDCLGGFRDEMQGAGFGKSITKTTELFLLSDGNIPVGLCGIMWHRTTCRFKNDYVAREYRSCGYYKSMMDFRMDLARKRGMKKIDAICTPMSINEYVKRGAVYVRYYAGWNLTHVKIDL